MKRYSAIISSALAALLFLLCGVCAANCATVTATPKHDCCPSSKKTTDTAPKECPSLAVSKLAVAVDLHTISAALPAAPIAQMPAPGVNAEARLTNVSHPPPGFPNSLSVLRI
ncbi:MAG: hypothetical protein IT165_35055 [Bryobacterales bacterium]|nr:hypothetical protein [Bryobacterales bacterium]